MTDWAITYLRHVLDVTGYSVNKLAQEAGVATSTLNRPLNTPNWRHKLSRDTIQKVYRATGIDPTPFTQAGMADTAKGLDLRSMPPRPETRADRVLQGLPPPPTVTRTPAISISVENGVAMITATVDRAGLDQLRRKLDAVEALLDDGDNGTTGMT